MKRVCVCTKGLQVLGVGYYNLRFVGCFGSHQRFRHIKVISAFLEVEDTVDKII